MVASKLEVLSDLMNIKLSNGVVSSERGLARATVLRIALRENKSPLSAIKRALDREYISVDRRGERTYKITPQGRVYLGLN